jgi:hypothetical protein
MISLQWLLVPQKKMRRSSSCSVQCFFIIFASCDTSTSNVLLHLRSIWLLDLNKKDQKLKQGGKRDRNVQCIM